MSEIMSRAEREGEHRQSDYAGILLHNGAESIADAEAAVRAVHFIDDIQVVNDPALVSRLVPLALQQDASSWLVLYSPRDASSDTGPRDVLLLPFPDGHSPVASTVSQILADVAFRLLEVIRGSITTTWVPALGVQNIQQQQTPTLGHQEILVPRFQLIHSDTPLFDPSRSPSALATPRSSAAPASSAVDLEAAIGDAVREASTIKSQQSTGLRLGGSSGDQQSSKAATQLARINQRLYERIRDAGGEVVVPAVVAKFKSVMDPETAQFLISAATVARFVEQHPAISKQFDYSLPGSALCKAVEREAKRSIRWFLGRKLKKIKFEDVEITLAGSPGLAQKLGDLLDAELHREVVGAHADALPARLNVIRKHRNSLAHIDAASRAEYSELLRLVLAPVEKPEESTLGIILRWKQKEIASGITL